MSAFALIALVRRLAGCRGGVALVEFALALPLLLVLYSGTFVISDLVSCKRKVVVSARTLTDTTSRYVALTQSDASIIMAAISQEMLPYDASSTVVRLSEVQICPGGKTASVVWSVSQNGTPYATGATVQLATNMFTNSSPLVPTTACSNGAYFIFGEVSYPYKPSVGMGSQATVNLYDSALISPRASNSIGMS
ncbi:MAG TPA: TadE/TadG family type IV pilus assembly protein [Novosphingobium sp.]|nr:TadE/TadG family type IV pilus assembly protein [Novosphingobium sp.]